MGQSLLMLTAYCVLFIVYWLTICCSKSLKKRLAMHLFWNGPIRLFMEVYLETALLSVLNLKNLTWSTDSALVISSNVLAIILMVFILTVPVFLISFKCKRKQVWHHYWFKERYGTLMKDMKLESSDDLRWSYILVPLMFFARRIVLVACIFFVTNYLQV